MSTLGRLVQAIKKIRHIHWKIKIKILKSVTINNIFQKHDL